MAKYVLLGKYSSSYAEGMIHSPHDRMAIVKPLLKNMDAELLEFLFIPSNPINDFVAIVETEDEKKLHAAILTAYATGSFENLNACKAYSNIEMTEIFQIGHDGMNSYITTKQKAGLE